MVTTSALEGFEKTSFSASRQTHDVFRAGSGPAVIVIHEVPGITPLVAAFGRRVAAAGFSAVLPNLFGTPGEEMTIPYALKSMLHGCVSREFVMFATGKTSPVTQYLRALAHHEHARCGGPGVGAVGMCLTGGFALAMSVDDVMLAPVLSQPSMPMPLGASRRRDLGISDADLAAVKNRARDGLCVMGLRFTGDKAAPAERFERLRTELGDNFIGVEIDSSEGNPWGYRTAAHSVLTEDYSDADGSPTRQALEDVLAFFGSRLKSTS
ncbi:MAG: dienelactone hydrolase family protein [Acidimicrobiales bacterium]